LNGKRKQEPWKPRLSYKTGTMIMERENRNEENESKTRGLFL
jgi:hypothetical protein